MVVIVDDPPHTAGTILFACDIAGQAGFIRDRLRVLAPTHPAKRNWFRSLPDNLVVSLEPEQWHKNRLLAPEVVESRLAEYFQRRNFSSTCLVASSRVEEFNARLQDFSSGGRGPRLKRIYEVRLQTPQGQQETRYVLAKSVGWGWLGYHAFLAGNRLSGFVPPVLGLRDGIIYMEWFPQPSDGEETHEEPEDWIETSALYVAARGRCLKLRTSPTPRKGLQRHENGARLLAEALSKAYGRIVTGRLMQPRVERRLAQLPCPCPTLIDGKMGRAEWIVGSEGWLKTDYEHHGMGKAELNAVDPARDLAETIMNLALSPEEENKLIRRYVEESGDTGVERRLFMNKLLAGVWTMDAAQEHLFDKPQVADRQQQWHQQFMSAWNFLTVHSARYCGVHCGPPRELHWSSPLVALDVDGVLDRRLFGFPCTSAAAMEALSLLRAHDLCVTVNTARSAAEVRDYCQAYSLCGGVAEHGSYLWDAVAQRGQVLISVEAVRQLNELRRNLQRFPGVFLDDRHQYSIRTFTYQNQPPSFLSALLKSPRSFGARQEAPAPLPTLLVNHLITDLGLDRLCFHHTRIDTAILAKDVDKGTGLSALRDWVLGPVAETIAVGDSAMDLPMFRAATRSFAPAHIDCARQARLLGCQIARHPYQRGLLDIVRTIIHPDGARCEQCTEGAAIVGPAGQDPFLDVLRAADQKPTTNLLWALCDASAFRMFVR